MQTLITSADVRINDSSKCSSCGAWSVVNTWLAPLRVLSPSKRFFVIHHCWRCQGKNAIAFNEMSTHGLNVFTNDSWRFTSWNRSVTRLDGAQGKKQVWHPHVRTWGLSEANVLYWRKYLWHCWDFSAPSQGFGTRGVVPPLCGGLEMAPHVNKWSPLFPLKCAL